VEERGPKTLNPSKPSFIIVIPHSEMEDKPERGIGETHSPRGGSDSVGSAATLNGP